MDVYFHTSTSATEETAAVVNNKHNDRPAAAAAAAATAAATRSFWKLARMMSKHDHRIAPSNAQQVTSLKKRAMQYFTAATATKPTQQQGDEQKQQIASRDNKDGTTAIPPPALLPAINTTNTTSVSLSTIASSSATTTQNAASTTVVGAATASHYSGDHLKKSPSGQSASPSTESSYRLRKAMAWLGRSFHRFQYSSLIKFQKRKMENNASSLPSLGDYAPLSTGRHAFEDSERPFTYTSSNTGSKKKEMDIHVKVLRITNLASSKERDYELDIRVNDVSQTLVRGSLSKVTKKISSSKNSSSAITVPVKEDEQVSLEFVVATQAPKQLIHSITKAITNHHYHHHTSKNVAAQHQHQQHEQPLQVVGVARVPHNGTVGKRETRRYKLANPNQIKGWDLDLTVELSYTQKQQQQKQQQKQQPPWTFYTHTSGLSDLSVSDDDEDCDHETLQQARSHCHQGDYLTFYVRGKTFPTWERFWVTLQENRLWLRNFSYKDQREPIDSIPLQHLSRVTKPSLDDQDRVCVGRSHGLVLQLNPEGILMDNDDNNHRQEEEEEEREPLEGKVFLFADNATNALYWRRALAAYTSNATGSKPSASSSSSAAAAAPPAVIVTNGLGVHSKYVC